MWKDNRWYFPDEKKPVIVIELTSNDMLYRVENLSLNEFTTIQKEVMENPQALLILPPDFPKESRVAIEAFRKLFSTE